MKKRIGKIMILTVTTSSMSLAGTVAATPPPERATSFSNVLLFEVPSGSAAAQAAVLPGLGEDLVARFNRLAARWRAKAGHLSSSRARAMVDEYQSIIGLGPAVVPLLLDDLKGNHASWFWALRAITDADPVPETDRGDYKAMARHWITWGRDHRLC